MVTIKLRRLELPWNTAYEEGSPGQCRPYQSCLSMAGAAFELMSGRGGERVIGAFVVPSMLSWGLGFQAYCLPWHSWARRISTSHIASRQNLHLCLCRWMTWQAGTVPCTMSYVLSHSR